MEAIKADAARGVGGSGTADGGRSEESLVRSLAELRAIELQRQTEERAAADAAIQARRREREAAAQAARDAEAARVAAERAAQVAAERARAAAEREARMQIEAIEAAERARRLIALEEHRVAEQLALQREAALRQRPRGLIALTALALAAAAGLGWLALDRAGDAAAAAGARDRAVAAVDRAERAAGEARQALAQTARELAELQSRFEALRRAAAAPAEPSLRPADPRTAPVRTPRGRPVVTPAAPTPPPRVQISEDCLTNALCDHPGPSAAAPAARRM